MFIHWILIEQYSNPFTDTGNYNTTSNDRKLVHWPLVGGTARRGLGRAAARSDCSLLYHM